MVYTEKRLNEDTYSLLDGEEIIGKRDECIKHFDLGEGRYQSVMYADPIHYKKGGVWREISGDLKVVQNGSRQEYRTWDHPLSFSFAQITDDAEMVRITSDTHFLAWKD